jgi:hypothetical protein
VKAHRALNYENRDFLGLHRDGPFTPPSLRAWHRLPAALTARLAPWELLGGSRYWDLSGPRPHQELGPGLITKGTTMRSIKMAGVLFILALALSAVAGIGATTASAAPELLPDSGVITEYTFTAKSGAGELVDPVSGLSIKCKSDKITLASTKITSTTHFEADVDFEQCEAFKLAARSLGDVNDTTEPKLGLILTKVLGLLCLFKDGSPLEVGVFFELDSPVHIEVPLLGELLEVKGSVIGVFNSTDLNVLKTGVYTLKLAKPNPKECEGKKASLIVEKEHLNPLAAEEITTEEITFDKDVKIDG